MTTRCRASRLKINAAHPDRSIDGEDPPLQVRAELPPDAKADGRVQRPATEIYCDGDPILEARCPAHVHFEERAVGLLDGGGVAPPPGGQCKCPGRLSRGSRADQMAQPADAQGLPRRRRGLWHRPRSERYPDHKCLPLIIVKR